MRIETVIVAQIAVDLIVSSFLAPLEAEGMNVGSFQDETEEVVDHRKQM